MAEAGVRLLPRLPWVQWTWAVIVKHVGWTSALRTGCVLALCGVLGGVLTGCGGPGPGARADRGPPGLGDETPGPEYVIGPGDGLGIFVYRSPELSIDVPVRPDGRISIPLVPDIAASGRTPTQLSGDIADKLKQYVKDPVVTVIVRSFIGPFDRQVRVIGEATDPQAIAYRDHMTLLDVMIATKGLTRYAAGNSASIVRRTPQGDQVIKVRLDDLLKDGDITQNVDMRPGDTLIIPQTWF
ncbi:MAG: polysaccharide export protein [Acidisphaera sp.]|nr:polysaccharide export protein [Acidisphaera sp.]MBV9813466.1 polysaccharide export protein [Acetobacteraceae bacterium]